MSTKELFQYLLVVLMLPIFAAGFLFDLVCTSFSGGRMAAVDFQKWLYEIKGTK